MSCYRRFRLPGATYFFTLRLEQRGSSLLTERIEDLRRAWAAMMLEAPVGIDAIVILPDHLHAIWTLPAGDGFYSERWRRIKARFSHAVGGEAPSSVSKATRREAGIWQRRFWEHTIRDAADYRRHLDYCWSDPVRHGLVERAADWPHSSLGRDIRAGLADPDWRAELPDGAFGE